MASSTARRQISTVVPTSNTRADGEEIIIASRQIIQRNDKGLPVAILEDVVTTGGSAVKAIERVREHGLKVLSPALVNRDKYSGTEVRRRMQKGGEWESLVPAPVAALSLMARFRSRDAESFGDRLLAALRNQFGGHAVKKEA